MSNSAELSQQEIIWTNRVASVFLAVIIIGFTVIELVSALDLEFTRNTIQTLALLLGATLWVFCGIEWRREAGSYSYGWSLFAVCCAIISILGIYSAVVSIFALWVNTSIGILSLFPMVVVFQKRWS